MNDPQIWTFIGVFSAIVFASNRQLSSSIRRELGAKIGGLDDKLTARIDGLDAKLTTRIDGVDQSLSAKMDAHFVDVEHRLDSLEGDMHIIKAHLIGQSTVTQARG
ncbi:MAG: hypothetical protein ACTHJM_00815 [Marmoricola sp.]